MKALIVITGRGLGGDSVIAYNIIEGLEAKGVLHQVCYLRKKAGHGIK